MPMRLTSSKAEEYPKFQNAGDKVAGLAEDWLTVQGKFGFEKHFILRGDQGQRIIVRATTVLASIIEENIARLRGKRVTITLTRFKPTTKGSPMKLYDVFVDDDAPPVDQADATAVDDDLTF